MKDILKMVAVSSLTYVALFAFTVHATGPWNAAPSNPPSGNVAGPLSTGNGSQTKAGGDISLGGGGSLYAGGLVATNKICLGSSCITSWPSGASAPTGPTPGSVGCYLFGCRDRV